jgi:hypothetical protein
VVTPVILPTQEAEIRRSWKIAQAIYPNKTFTEVGLVEWLKVKALSSSPSTKKKKIFLPA